MSKEKQEQTWVLELDGSVYKLTRWQLFKFKCRQLIAFICPKRRRKERAVEYERLDAMRQEADKITIVIDTDTATKEEIDEWLNNV